ncbi:hypothetical protein [Flavobacterium solisilvae]|uniref:Uncharacterized protein n=1 Tax=Flavobacterium solisilvae TaxID=1852019 RepID=A0ABX1QSF1_9FLAO|nr:hypothetical protein [Flavobacterium solisilvae]NMH24089.1 hypothetical protein [Flavobacterium solisilvae]
MSKQIEIEAFYDSLSIAHKLDQFLDGFTNEEIHLFSYFSAFLFHYSGNPIEEWKYKFTIDSNGYPFSTELQNAIERHESIGLFELRNFLTITSRGTDEFNKFSKELSLFKEREKFIEAACSTSILIPYQEAKEALLEDVNITKARNLGNESWLDFQYEKLHEITSSLGAAAEDMTISAVTWLRLVQLSQKTEI